MLAALVTDLAKIQAMNTDAMIIQGLASFPWRFSPRKNPPTVTVLGEMRNIATPYTTRNPQNNNPVQSVIFLLSFLSFESLQRPCRIRDMRIIQSSSR